jgi:hypothetical protein
MTTTEMENYNELDWVYCLDCLVCQLGEDYNLDKKKAITKKNIEDFKNFDKFVTYGSNPFYSTYCDFSEMFESENDHDYTIKDVLNEFENQGYTL